MVSMEAELSKAVETRALEDIRFLQGSIAETAKIRELFPDDWEIQEDCRHIIFLSNQNIQILMEEIELARATRKDLERV